MKPASRSKTGLPVEAKLPGPGSKTSAVVPATVPPVISTSPLGRSVAAWASRARVIVAERSDHVSVAGS